MTVNGRVRMTTDQVLPQGEFVVSEVELAAGSEPGSDRKAAS